MARNLSLTPLWARNNLSAMTGRTLGAAIVQGVLVGLCICGPLHASQGSKPLNSQEREQDLETLRVDAEAGDDEAQYQLGERVSNSRFGPGSNDEAAHWFRLAAGQGHIRAQISLGFMYSLGLGVERDAIESVRWYRLAAEQGDADGQFELGQAYKTGQGTPVDHTEAVRWYGLAAAQGLSYAQYELGLLYRDGEGVAQDDIAADMWLTLAAAQFMADQGEPFEPAVTARDEVQAQMAPGQIAEAERLAREWKPNDRP